METRNVTISVTAERTITLEQHYTLAVPADWSEEKIMLYMLEQGMSEVDALEIDESEFENEVDESFDIVAVEYLEADGDTDDEPDFTILVDDGEVSIVNVDSITK